MTRALFAFNVICFLPLCSSAPAASPSSAGSPSSASTAAPTLGPRSSCDDLMKFQIANGGDYKQEFWNDTETDTYFSNWANNVWKDNGEESIFLNDFFAMFGEGNYDCSLTGGCRAISCSDLGDRSSEPGSAAIFQIATAMGNYLRNIQKLWGAFLEMRDYWSSNKDFFSSTFNPTHTAQSSPLAFQMLMYSLLFPIMFATGFIGIATTLTASTVFMATFASNAVQTGVFMSTTGASKKLTDDFNERNKDEDAFKDLVKLSQPINDFLDTQTISQDVLDGMKLDGVYDQSHLVDVLKGGNWADVRTIPLQNENIISSRTWNEYNDRFITGMVVNWCWHQENVWLQSFPMTEEEFNTHVSPAQNDEARMKHWYKGRGYYMQSFYDDPYGGLDFRFTAPRSQNPPGWAEAIGHGIDIHRAIEASVDNFDRFGYDQPHPQNVSELMSDDKRTMQDALDFGPYSVFNMQICNIDTNDDLNAKKGQSQLDAFFDSLMWPRAIRAVNKKSASFCYCFDKTDKNGKKFRDQNDFANYEKGSKPACNAYTYNIWNI